MGVHVRGVMLLNGMRFVRESYGADRHEAVLARLHSECRTALTSPIREAAWKPLDDFVAYLEAAQALLAPGDDEFFRRPGRFAGGEERAGSNFRLMVEDPPTAMRLGPIVWRAFHDAGRLTIEPLSDHESISRLYDFPASVAMCQRRCGAWEALLSTEQYLASVDEPRCRPQGHPSCDTHTLWSPR